MSNVRAEIELIDITKTRDQDGLLRATLNSDDLHQDLRRDESNVASVYYMAHQFSLQHPERRIIIQMQCVGNQKLRGILQSFREHPVLLPENVTLKISMSSRTTLVRGKGAADAHFHANARKLVELAELDKSRCEGRVNVALGADFYEFELLRKVKLGAPAMALLLDADDCLYNFKYRIMLMKLIYKYSQEIKACALADNLDEESCDKLCDRLMDEVTQTDFTAFTDEETNQYVDFVNEHGACTDEDILQESLHGEDYRYININRQYIRYLDKMTPAIMTYILYRANEGLFERAVQRAVKEKLSGIIVMSFSARQSEYDDLINSKNNGTGLFMHDLHELVRYLNDRYQSKMRFMHDRFLMPDAYHNLTPGESHKRKLTGSPEKKFTILDSSKVSYLLVFLHHLKRHYQGLTLVKICDDREDIFNRFMHIFHRDEHHGLLPENTLLQLFIYNGEFKEGVDPVAIKGSGKIHPHADLAELLATNARCQVKLQRIKDAPVGHDFGSGLDFPELALAMQPKDELQLLLHERRQGRLFQPAVIFQQPLPRRKEHHVPPEKLVYRFH